MVWFYWKRQRMRQPDCCSGVIFDRISSVEIKICSKHQTHFHCWYSFPIWKRRYAIRQEITSRGWQISSRWLLRHELQQWSSFWKVIAAMIYYVFRRRIIPEMRYYTERALDASVQANNRGYCRQSSSEGAISSHDRRWRMRRASPSLSVYWIVLV